MPTSLKRILIVKEDQREESIYRNERVEKVGRRSQAAKMAQADASRRWASAAIGRINIASSIHYSFFSILLFLSFSLSLHLSSFFLSFLSKWISFRLDSNCNEPGLIEMWPQCKVESCNCTSTCVCVCVCVCHSVLPSGNLLPLPDVLLLGLSSD